jgi:hypothetical protein
MHWPMRRARCSRSDKWPRRSNIRARCSSQRREPCMLPPTSTTTPKPASKTLCSASTSAPFMPSSFTCMSWQLKLLSPGQGISSTIQPGVSSSCAGMGLRSSRWVAAVARVFSAIDRSSMNGSSTTIQGGNSSSVPVSCQAPGVLALTSRLQPAPGSAMVASRANYSALAFF